MSRAFYFYGLKFGGMVPPGGLVKFGGLMPLLGGRPNGGRPIGGGIGGGIGGCIPGCQKLPGKGAIGSDIVALGSQ